MPQKMGKIRLYMGPTETGGPDDLKKAIIDFIDGAEKKLEIAVQELDEEGIGVAIVRARQRGVRVRMVLEGDYLRDHRLPVNSWEPGGKNEENRRVLSAILRTTIDARSDYNPNIFHQKFIVRDGRSLLTGSTNFTKTGISKNLNHVVIVHDEGVAKTYAKEYREIWQGRFGRLGELAGKPPKDVEVSNVPIRMIFAPDHNPEMEIMKQMLKTKRRIDFAIFTFAQSSGIDDTMIALSKGEHGHVIRGVLDRRVANQKWAAGRPVRNAGAELYKIRAGVGIGKLHHKLMVLDKQVVIAGSFNYTKPATRLNDENVIILGDLETETTKQSSIEAQKKLAKYALDEIDRIIVEKSELIDAS